MDTSKTRASFVLENGEDFAGYTFPITSGPFSVDMMETYVAAAPDVVKKAAHALMADPVVRKFFNDFLEKQMAVMVNSVVLEPRASASDDYRVKIGLETMNFKNLADEKGAAFITLHADGSTAIELSF